MPQCANRLPSTPVQPRAQRVCSLELILGVLQRREDHLHRGRQELRQPARLDVQHTPLLRPALLPVQVRRAILLALQAEVVRARQMLVTQPQQRTTGSQNLDPANLFFDSESRAVQASAPAEAATIVMLREAGTASCQGVRKIDEVSPEGLV